MRGDIPAPAFRLLNALPVRTHERKTSPVYLQGSKNGRAIVIDGTQFPSILRAKKALRVSSDTIYEWLSNGNAVRG